MCRLMFLNKHGEFSVIISLNCFSAFPVLSAGTYITCILVCKWCPFLWDSVHAFLHSFFSHCFWELSDINFSIFDWNEISSFRKKLGDFLASYRENLLSLSPWSRVIPLLSELSTPDRGREPAAFSASLATCGATASSALAKYFLGGSEQQGASTSWPHSAGTQPPDRQLGRMRHGILAPPKKKVFPLTPRCVYGDTNLKSSFFLM